MKKFAIRCGLLFVACILRIRYKITYKGLDEVRQALKDNQSGCLFLPNHPAVVVDPLIVSIPLLQHFGIRPLIVEYMYYQPAFHFFMRAIDAIAIPNFSTGFNPLKLKRAERMLQNIAQGLKNNERFLIYPAGTTKHQAREVIGGAFGVHQLLSDDPDVPIVLVRTTGLWGSSFSRALTQGDSPDTKKALKKGLWTFFKNLFLFVPKRKITVEFSLAASDLPRKGTKQELNRYLENWYNAPFGAEGEPLSLVSYAFWKKELLLISEQKQEKLDLSSVSEEIKNQVANRVAELAKVPASQILPDLKLGENLGLDSLDMAELISFLEEQFDADGIIPQDLHTVGSIYLAASGAYKKKEQVERRFDMAGWNEKRAHELLTLYPGNSLVEVFLRACDANLSKICVADPLRGPTTFAKFKTNVLLLSQQIAKLKGERIGILLPSSAAAFALVLACQIAKKTPVMINWTVGGKHLDTVVDVSKIEVVLSSWSFLDALENVDISRIEPLLFVLEEMRLNISFFDLLKAKFMARKSADTLLSSLHVPHGDDEAVVLFTSGTESMPKGVPLTHSNILFDLRASLQRVCLYRDDKLLAMLPPFHSFGFSVTGLLPLLCGVRAVYYPNPTDSKRLAKAIEKWNITLLCSAPTFLKNILQATTRQQAKTLRVMISGAEKAPDDLFSLWSKVCPQVQFIEGYGITECAPVLSANTTLDREKGVGSALGGIEIIVVDPEKIDERKAVNEIGLILAKGPNVFSGYLNRDVHDPFVQINGEKWYSTGDLGKLDQEGNLILSGRLKRFIKIGGEMVSMGAIEETLASQTESTQEQFAVMADGDLLGKVRLVLFTTHALEPVQVNQMLRKGGFGNLVKIDKVIRLKAIPQTATGKIAFRQLEKMLQPQ